MGFLQFLYEGKVDDFKKLFSDKYTTPEQINAIITVSSEVDDKHKYLIWLAKTLTKPVFNNEIAFGEELSEAQELLMKFKTIGPNLPIKDISQYKNISELADAIKTYENRQRRTIKKVDGADIIYDDDDYTIVHPKEYNASCYYGEGSKWCTSSKNTDSHWYSYNKEAKLFYFLSKKLPTSNDFYKVALLQGYNGKKSFWNAFDDPFDSGWILGTDYMNDLLEIVEQYMKDNYSREIGIFSDEQKAKIEAEIERQRLQRIETQRIINQKRRDAESRRETDEWNPEEVTHGEVGAHAWALFIYLTEYGNLVPKEPGDTERLEFINSELDRLSELQNQYEVEGRDLTGIDAEISALEEEKDELEKRVDVYDMIPEGGDYAGMSIFSVTSPDYDGYEWTVGDDDQIKQAAFDRAESLIDDIGYEGFNSYLVERHIDADAVANEARDNYEYWVRDNPESYLDETDRELSKSQQKEIDEFQEKIYKYTSFREKATERQENYDSDSREWKALEKGIDKLTDLISDLEYDIVKIKEEPDGDWDEDKIEEKIDDLVDDVKRNPLDWLKEMGIEKYDDYINKDEFIEDIIDSDGYYQTLNSYNGDGDTVEWDGETYHIMNTDR
jgi:hypothetical protein